MSLYNLLHGVNFLAPFLLAALDIDQPEGKWDSGGSKDIYLNEDGTEIILFTRNGGGNREYYFPGKIQTHPNYLRDYDDDFDCTYCYIEFEVPKGFKRTMRELAPGKKPKTLKQRTDEYLDKLKKGEVEVPQKVKDIFEKITEGKGGNHEL